MGLLRRPTTSGIVEDGRLGRPCGPGAPSRTSRKPIATTPLFLTKTYSKAGGVQEAWPR
jgi:hypothetical protein